jgi:hypothetical protein
MGVGGEGHGPAALPKGKTRCHCIGGWVGPRGRFGRLRKISLPPRFDPGTVLPVARRYTDRATATHENKYIDMEKRLFQKEK